MTLPPEEQEDGAVGGRPRAAGSFSRSLFGAAARGTGLVALAVVIGIVLLQYSDDPTADRRSAGRAPAGDVAPLSASSSTTTTTAPPRAASEVRVLVLNGASRQGAAREMSGRLGVVGYQTLDPGDAPVRGQSTVGCRAGLEREAAALASATGLPAEIADPGALLPEEADCVVVIGSG